MFADKPVGLIALDFNRIGPDFMGAIDQIAAFMHRTVVIGTYLADNVRRFADADASIGYFHGFYPVISSSLAEIARSLTLISRKRAFVVSGSTRSAISRMHIQRSLLLARICLISSSASIILPPLSF